MKDIIRNIKIALLNKKIILIVMISIIFLGLLFGSIYITILDNKSKEDLMNNVSIYFNSYKDYTFSNKISIFKDTFIKDLIYFLLLWASGISIIGMPIIFIMNFYKSFILGFSIGSIFAKYKILGLFKILVYIFPCKLLILVLSIIMGSYGVNLSLKLISYCFRKKSLNFNMFMGKYLFIFIISILICILDSLLEAFINPLIYNII